jgi:23S rRNA (uracil1939-C5)-methyltransferase
VSLSDTPAEAGVNDMRVVDLKIEDIAFGGKGVAREQGKAVFVPYTIEGELVSAEIVREKKQFAEADLVEVKQSSPDRVAPECPYFGRCGGCAYQHIDYEHQLAIKWRQVRDALQRIGKLKDVPMRPIIPSPRQYAYRNRITVHALDGVIGFFRRDSHRLIDIERCPISREEVNRALGGVARTKTCAGRALHAAECVRAARVFAGKRRGSTGAAGI